MNRALSLLVAVAAACAVLPAAAAAAPPGPTVDAETVVLSLRPDRPELLARTAASTVASLAARRGAVARAMPGPARADRVESWLTSHGFSVTDSGPLTVTAAAPTAMVDRAFGVGVVPPELAADVRTVVTPADAHRWHPQQLPGGTLPATLAGAYARPGGALGAGATVATVQFSGWPALADPSHGDLATWADAADVALPSITAIGVNGADPFVADGTGGDAEVALDQEALMAVAPQAAQRVYVTTNGDAVGGVAVWDRVLADVRDGVGITAVSTSWGACEAAFGRREVAAVEQDLAALSALGVAVFAASGDYSAYDCGGTRLSVDYPASSPEVVGVGGTDLTANAGQYAEIAWGGTSSDGVPGYGSGGGVSALFGRPTWQQSVATGLSAARVVPDISSEAAPRHGLAVVQDGQWSLSGGTSLGAPTQAGLYAATLAAAGHPTGAPVEVHAALYGAPATALRDITTGTNHAYAAVAGYDPVTGLGSPQWTALSSALTGTVSTPSATTSTGTSGGTAAAPTTTDTGASASSAGTADDATTTPTADGTTSGTTSAGPTVGTTGSAPVVDASAPVAFARAVVRDHRLHLRWSALDASLSSGVAGYRVTLKVRRDGDVRVLWVRHYSKVTALDRLARSGRGYRLAVVALDRAGNRSVRAASSWVRYSA